ncbi:MAG: thiol peroxidase [Gammaproteobacteria bacterium]|nr:thiol peroxidase [Gammaproteobacteria bacterium]
MSSTKFKGNLVHLAGHFPRVGSKAPAFKLIAGDLSEKSLADFPGKRKVLNIFPSIDTGVCAASVRRFNKEAASLKNAVVLCISADLPFAQARFCGAEGIQNVTMLSMMRGREFMQDYGVAMTDGPLAGLAARAVVVLEQDDKVVHAQLVEEITQEPDYAAALRALS